MKGGTVSIECGKTRVLADLNTGECTFESKGNLEDFKYAMYFVRCLMGLEAEKIREDNNEIQ